ncbi:uncharacterized protein FIBRA_06168 [Fibroporia radiculosa]|uniref:F-box domain-containing protein n=1 Tax=Fibroporia radiculosa TaxID=599839 RepID=J4IB43_9APHY|nr:uncharacterized protein FIBRA_06168 [Fibroporia radiculosa]CCM04011.1 predicted protein [Fibroporia radiculosa]
MSLFNRIGPVFPSELFDFIIDFLWDDRPSLKITLAERDDCYNLQRLIDATAARADPLGGYVRELSITRIWARGGDPCFSSRYFRELIPSLVARLIYVDQLNLTGLSWGGIFEVRADVVAKFLTLYPALKVLRLTRMTFRSAQDLYSLLTAHPLLHTLYITSVNWESEGSGSTALLPVHQSVEDKPIQLRELLLSFTSSTFEPYFASIGVFLMAPPFTLDLRRLQWVSTPHSSGQQTLNTLVRRAGSRLECLRVALPLRKQHLIPDQVLDISSNTNLVELQVDCDGRTRSIWQPTFLSKIRSRLFRALDLNFDLRHCPPQVDFLDWEYIDNVITSLTLSRPNLIVRFSFRSHITDTIWTTDLIRDVAAGLPGVHAAGIGVGILFRDRDLDDIVVAEHWLSPVALSQGFEERVMISQVETI